MSEHYSAQAIAKAIVPKIPGLLSAFSSCYVIYDILRKKTSSGNRNRLLIGLSISDAIGSIAFGFVSSWAIPKGTPGVFLAAGNDATCKVQGFLLQLCNTTSPLYSGSLSFYYLVTITKGWSEDDVNKYRVLLHGIPIFFGVSTAVVGLVLDLYHPVGLWCWFGPPGPHYDAFRWGMAHSFIWSTIFFGVYVMTMLYREVRQLETASEKYDIQNSLLNTRRRRDGQGTSSVVRIGSTVNGHEEKQGERLSKVMIHRISALVKEDSLLSKGEAKKRRRSKAVAIQGMMFSGAYFLAYIGGFLTRLVQSITGKVYFWLIIIMAALLPAQGIFNFIVYMRPRWRRSGGIGRTEGGGRNEDGEDLVASAEQKEEGAMRTAAY